ncbi:MAG: hypothetical protein ABSB59_13375 [Streptosporangiaceae bacterium]|jgi:hypothetical protein
MRNTRRIAAAAVASGMIAAGALALSTSAASASTLGAHLATGYSFQTVDNAGDPTFNQLLGVNDLGVIAGYLGSGAQGHPNKGYQLLPRRNYVNENFPGSVQTQVTGLNNRGVTVGFWSSMNNANQVNDNHGFVDVNGHFRTADFPTGAPAAPPVDQLLGVNDSDVAVGFYTDASGNNHGYEFNAGSGRFSTVSEAGVTSLTAAAINDRGDVAGFYTNPRTGNTDGFLKAGHSFIDLAVPGASATTALGVNSHDEVVGAFTTGSGDGAQSHGFSWTPQGGFRTLDDPHGMGTTTINGVNDFGVLVGFYVDANGNTDGFVATP